MENWIYLVLITLLFYAIFYVILPENTLKNENFNGAITQLTHRGLQDVYLTVDTEKYIDPVYTCDQDCDGVTCGSPYCRANYYNYYDWWYGYTPFAWGNSTRRPRAPYYSYIYNWYRDTYGYPYYYWY